MTFFLQDAQRDIPANSVRRVTSTGFGEGLMAASSAAAIENDANFKAGRTRKAVETDLIRQGVEAVGPETVWQRMQEEGLAPQVPWSSLSERRREIIQFPPETLRILSQMQEQDPEAFGDLDLTEAGIETRTNEELQKEYEAARAAVEMMPFGQGLAEFAGGMIGPTVDVKNIPFMLFTGGSGGFLRIMGRNAAINMAAEGAFLPAQFEMAERLDIPDPSIPGQLAMAGIAGGAFGAGEEAVRRGLRYFRTRNLVSESLTGFEAAQWDARIAEAEQMLQEGGEDALQQIARAPSTFPNQPAQMPPLITRVQTAEGGQGVPAANAPQAEPTAQPEAPEQQPGPTAEVEADQGAVDALQVEIDALRTQDGKSAKPLLDFLMNGHRVPKARRGAGEADGPSLQIDPNGPLGQELAARDITRRSNPRLFRNGGRENLDNLVASEMENMYPGIIEATGTQRGAEYLDEQGLIDLIVREQGGDSTWLQSRARAAELEAQQFEIEVAQDRTPEQDFTDGLEADGGFFIDKNAYEFLHGFDAPARIASDVDAYVNEIGFALSDAERAELIAEVSKTGGDVDFLLERIALRDEEVSRLPDAEDIYDPIPGFDDAPTDEGSVSPRGRDSDESDVDTGSEGTRTQGAEAARDPVTESTPEGEQTLIPGVAPITQQDRLQQAQSAPMRGGDAAMDVGLFDTGARAQRDMFDDPGQEASRPVMDQASADMREATVSDDFEVDVDMPDGTTRRMMASQALDNMDDIEAFSARLDLCGSVPQQ